MKLELGEAPRTYVDKCGERSVKRTQRVVEPKKNYVEK